MRYIWSHQRVAELKNVTPQDEDDEDYDERAIKRQHGNSIKSMLFFFPLSFLSSFFISFVLYERGSISFSSLL